MRPVVKTWVTNIVLMTITAGAAVAIGGRLPRLVEEWRGPIRNGDFSEHVDKQPYRLTLYGTSTCVHCLSARAYLNKAGIAFNDLIVDQSKPVEESYKKLNQSGVPILVSEKQLVVGFNAKAFDEISKNQVLK